ncbi:glycosyltransferase [Rhodobacterales bacterium HKCCE2091]|nr:glycosyltransferase [Rhodobacterales bacterium HKCCE2091]
MSDITFSPAGRRGAGGLQLAAVQDPVATPHDSRAPNVMHALLSVGALPDDNPSRLPRPLETAGAYARRLVLDGSVPERTALAALALSDGTRLLDLATDPSDPGLAPLLGPETAVALGAVPYARNGDILVVATCRPDLAAEIRGALPGERVVIALAPRDQVTAEIGYRYGAALARSAESRAPQATSCRVWSGVEFGHWIFTASLALTLLALAATLAAQVAMFGFAGLVFIVNMALKVAAWAAAPDSASGPAAADISAAVPIEADPVITILVPLFREQDIADKLLARLSRLDYPRDRLDVIFVLEEDDDTTASALAALDLPFWTRAIAVPAGTPRTKPRALNYALPFARGAIVGIYDAEDAPEPDQLRRVAARFASAPPGLACLQGQLDYYNSGHNWLSRCFTLEYATWFRLLLPGVAELGLTVPLGGTTVFISRDALIRVGAWDAHNVTEDAELGLRLARAGYRTEIIETTTFEEATSAFWPWIRQRSRWLKGYAITWATAMRQPLALWRDLGPRRFIGLQAQFLGTVAGFFTAPLLWSLALIPLGIPHPLAEALPAGAATAIAVAFAMALVVTLALPWTACAAPHLRRHRRFVPLLLLYFPLATIASFAAIIDLVIRPFYWAKTTHGRYGALSPGAFAI